MMPFPFFFMHNFNITTWEFRFCRDFGADGVLPHFFLWTNLIFHKLYFNYTEATVPLRMLPDHFSTNNFFLQVQVQVFYSFSDYFSFKSQLQVIRKHIFKRILAKELQKKTCSLSGWTCESIIGALCSFLSEFCPIEILIFIKILPHLGKFGSPNRKKGHWS